MMNDKNKNYTLQYKNDKLQYKNDTLQYKNHTLQYKNNTLQYKKQHASFKNSVTARRLSQSNITNRFLQPIENCATGKDTALLLRCERRFVKSVPSIA
jgi:hypothetical protein